MVKIAQLFSIKRYLVYSCKVQDTVYFENPNRTENLEITFIESVNELKEKLALGYNVSDIATHEERLDAGLTGCFAFVEKDYAHSTYICFSNTSRKLVDPLPYSIDFRNNETCSGLSITMPEYRRRGIYFAVYNEIFNWMKNRKGIVKARFTIRETNVGSRITLEK